MKCIVCLRKHLALFNSYAKEVLNGHGQGANPDHRIDLQGQINNAQYHASMIDEDLCRKIRCVRRSLIKKKFKVNEQDMKVIEAFYYYLDKFDNQEVEEKYVDIVNSIEIAPKLSDITNINNVCGCQSK